VGRLARGDGHRARRAHRGEACPHRGGLPPGARGRDAERGDPRSVRGALSRPRKMGAPFPEGRRVRRERPLRPPRRERRLSGRRPFLPPGRRAADQGKPRKPRGPRHRALPRAAAAGGLQRAHPRRGVRGALRCGARARVRVRAPPGTHPARGDAGRLPRLGRRAQHVVCGRALERAPRGDGDRAARARDRHSAEPGRGRRRARWAAGRPSLPARRRGKARPCRSPARPKKDAARGARGRGPRTRGAPPHAGRGGGSARRDL
jgi:hypothetical protein